MKKAQIHLDYFMTYGWALILFLFVIFFLLASGILDISVFVGTRVSGFTDIGIVNWGLSSEGEVGLQLENRIGKDIDITEIEVSIGDQTIVWNSGVRINSGGQTGMMVVGKFESNIPDIGQVYTLEIKISYTDIATKWISYDQGTVTGKVGENKG